MSLLRSDSCSSASSSHVDGGLDDLCALFAAGEVGPIVAGLLAMRATLTRDAPDTVHTCFSDALPEMLAASATPFKLVLQLLDEPALAQRGAAAGGKVDLRTLLVRALRSVCISERMHSLELWQQEEALKRKSGDSAASAAESSAEPDQDSAPAELTPALTARARELCLKGTYLNPRTFEAVVSLYRVQLTPRELLSYARTCFAQGAYRDAAEFLKAFRIETEEPSAAEILRGEAAIEDGFPHAALLTHLVASKQDMDVFLAYLNQSPTFLARHVHAALTNLAEQQGGNDPNLAAKLALRFGLPLASLPRVLHLKMRDIIWWVSRIGKGEDFGETIAGEDHALQRKLIRELTKSKAPQDKVLACSFLDRWPHQLKDKEYAEFYAHHKKIREEQLRKQTQPLTQEEKTIANVQAALKLHEANVAAASTSSSSSSAADPPSLLLPALPEPASASTPSSSLSSELPHLFLHPSAILMVDSIETLEVARKHLLDPATTKIGLDLEHLPENFVGLNIRPTLCQCLQIACASKVFLFDLQRLYEPKPAEVAAAASAAAAAASTPAPALSWAALSANGLKVNPATASPAVPSVFPVIPSHKFVAPVFDPSFRSGVNDLLLSLFLNEDLLKVGIGFAQDLRKLAGDFGQTMVCFRVTLQNYMGLEPLLKLCEDPDAPTRDLMKKRVAAEAKRKAIEKKRRAREAIFANENPAAKAKQAAAAAVAPAAAAPAAKPAAGLSSLFGGGDDDGADDDEDEPSSPTVASIAAALAAPAPTAAAPVAPASAAVDDAPVEAAAASASSATPATAPVALPAPFVGGGHTHASKKEGGLAKLVRMVLRRHLSKEEQISNWAKRPLSVPQMQYAALDAYVCILILDKVNAQGIELEVENIESSGL